MAKTGIIDSKYFGFEPHQTAMLIGKAEEVALKKGYSPPEILAACVVGGITYNGRRKLSVLRRSDNCVADLINCVDVLEPTFVGESLKMNMNPGYREKWTKKYQEEIQPEVEDFLRAKNWV